MNENVAATTFAELTRALEQERATREADERLAAAAFDGQQQELARVLHDTLSQSLNAARIYARVTRGALERSCPDAAESGAALEQAIRNAADELQALIRWLTPAQLDAADLVAGLGELSRLAARTLPCELRCKTDVEAEPEVAAELLRILQLALHHLVRRTRATAVELELEADEQRILVTVRAAGARPFSSELDALLARRAALGGGSFTARHEVGSGVTLTCVLPARP